MAADGRSAAAQELASALAKASFERCCARSDFVAAFYRHFFANCPGAEARFVGTDLDRQYRLLRHALSLLLLYPSQPRSEPSLLRRVAERHSRRDLDVHPSNYPCFVDCLILTVKEYDAEFTLEIERAWRDTVASGVEYMISKY